MDQKEEKKIGIKNKKLSVPIIILIVVACVAVISIILVLCSGGKSDKVKPLYDKDKQPIYISKEKVNDIYSNANQYKGQFIDVCGQVFNKKTEDGITLLQINANVDDAEDNTLIYYEGSTDIKPGITSSGIPTFPALEANDFNLIIEGSSDDLDIDLEKFQFLLDMK